MTRFTGMFSSLHFQKFPIFCLRKSAATWLILRKENALLPVQLREDYSPGVNLKSLTSEVRYEPVISKGTEELHLTVFSAKLTVQLQCNLTLLITDASTVHSALLNQK